MAQDVSKEEYVSQSENFLLKYNDYLQGYRVIRRQSDLKPFYIEMVDENGKPVDIPFPPLKDSESTNRILGLKLMINPASISVNLAKIINRTQTMVAWVEDHWGEEIDTVTLNGSSAAFIIGGTSLRDLSGSMKRESVDKATAMGDFYSYMGLNDYSVQTPAIKKLLQNEGLNVRDRRDTASYREMKKLVEIFSANGCIYDGSGFVSERKFIRITYDYSSYLGYFESFDLTEDSVTPFKFVYTITFKSEKTIYRFTAITR